jgi:hypothetical protein
MKCDDFLASLETGSALTRLQAHVHAWRCVKCAAVQKRLIELQHELARPEALTAFHRRVWERTASEALVEPKLRFVFWPRLAAVTALAAVVVLCVALFARKGDKDSRDRQVVIEDKKPAASGVQTIALMVPPGELAILENELKQVSADLDRLAEEATLIEVRQAIGELTVTYRPLGPNDS